ncbi:MAG TPA: hypothetical protein VKU19_40285 [Bryobacteraceae bacterium]|nr:hypothetical protein [Bryobacteraceae bacterium]
MNQNATGPIRQAIASGEFQRATLLWNEYAAGIREEIARGACTPDRMAEAGELLRWSSDFVMCERARAQAELDTIWVAARYGDAAATF